MTRHVAILGLGPSVGSYLSMARGLGGRCKLADEVWAINALGDVFGCDRIFHMDDVRIQEIRAAAQPESNIAAMLGWMKRHPGPIYTSRPHPDYPGLVAFPFEQVINDLKYPYFSSTVAYATALAIHEGWDEISWYGVDFTYPDRHSAEKGRACVEFWMGVAAERGIKLRMPVTTSLMDACVPTRERIYGYDTVDIAIARDANGVAKVTFTERPRDQWPGAEEIEARYDHSAHPNPLVGAT